MMKLRHFAPLVFVALAAACSKDQPPAESPSGEATSPPASEKSGDMDAGATPSSEMDGGLMEEPQPGSNGPAPAK